MNKYRITEFANENVLKNNNVGDIVDGDPALVEQLVRTRELELVSDETEEVSEASDDDLSDEEEAALLAEMKAEEEAKAKAEKEASEKSSKGKGSK